MTCVYASNYSYTLIYDGGPCPCACILCIIIIDRCTIDTLLHVHTEHMHYQDGMAYPWVIFSPFLCCFLVINVNSFTVLNIHYARWHCILIMSDLVQV